MKRHVITALIIGLVVTGLIIGVEIAGWLARPEEMAAGLIPETTKRVLPAIQYAVVVVAAIGVAFLALASTRRDRIGLIVGALVIEIAGVAWICSLYKVSFQPLPAMAAVVFAFFGVLLFEW